MKGRVDDKGRALLTISLRNPASGAVTPVSAWVDTAFSGDLVLPRATISAIGLPLGQAASAVLADGSVVTLDTYTAELDWFGGWRSVEVIANDGSFPLLGVGLLLGHELHVDYVHMTLALC